jgi:hypothetical protein
MIDLDLIDEAHRRCREVISAGDPNATFLATIASVAQIELDAFQRFTIYMAESLLHLLDAEGEDFNRDEVVANSIAFGFAHGVLAARLEAAQREVGDG